MHPHISSAGILGIAVTTYAVLQASKKAGLDGYISGRLGIVFAVVAAFVSTIAIAGNVSLNTICTALAVALAASGLHANAKVAATGTLAKPAVLKTVAALALAVLLPLGFSSCTSHVSLTSPASPQNIELAAATTDSVASGLKLAQDSLRTLHQAAEVSDSEAAHLNTWLAGVAQKNDAAIAAITAADSAGGTGWQAQLTAVAIAVAALPPSTFNIANPSAKATFTTAVGVLESAVAVITSGVGAKP